MKSLLYPLVYVYLWLEAVIMSFPAAHDYAKHQAPVLLRRRLK